MSFDCWMDSRLFDVRLDFAIRAWAGKSRAVRRLLDRSDVERLAALGDMFRRYGYAEGSAEVRARTLYYTQIGYYALDCRETVRERLKRFQDYIEVFTGQTASRAELAAFRRRHGITTGRGGGSATRKRA